LTPEASVVTLYATWFKIQKHLRSVHTPNVCVLIGFLEQRATISPYSIN